MKIRPDLKQAIDYIRNAGCYNIISETYYTTIKKFDEDYEPIGHMIRQELRDRRLVEEDDRMFIRLLK